MRVIAYAFSHAGGKRNELVADVDEAHPPSGTTTQLELEEAPVPTQRLVEVADLKRYG